MPAGLLEQAQDDAAELAIHDMERAGIDVITDGEVRRESYSNHLVSALEGVDAENPAMLTNSAGRTIPVPRIVGDIRRTRSVEVDALRFLRRMTDRPVKVTLPGPFTMTQQASDEWYHDPEAAAMAFAAAVNEEARDLQAAGADVIQLDEPWLRNDPIAADGMQCPRSTGLWRESPSPPPCTCASAARRSSRGRSRLATRSSLSSPPPGGGQISIEAANRRSISASSTTSRAR